jgi:ABC-type transport system involved in multi-copper enzyme maturation permease subunit
MSQLSLFALVPSWVSNWLTPVWIVGTGALIGLLVLAVLYLIALVLSRIPLLDALAENPSRRNRVALGVSVVAFVVLFCGLLLPNLGSWRADDSASVSANVILATSLLVPLALGFGYGLLCCCSRANLAELPTAIKEGPMAWGLTFAGSLAAFGILGAFIAFQPEGILKSTLRVPFVGEQVTTFAIPATPQDVLDDPAKDPAQHPIKVDLRLNELRQLVLESSQPLTISHEKAGDIDVDPAFEVSPDEATVWTKGTETFYPDGDRVSELHVRNYSSDDVTLTMTAFSLPEFPQARTIVITALAVVLFFLAYVIQRAAMPKLSAVAHSTFKSETAQPLFIIVLLTGVVSLAFFVWLPYSTFGEDIKVLKDSGMTLIMVLCIIQAIWAASTSVADEIDGKTALTVLSKPISRWSFIIGKYMGIFWTVAVLFIVLGLVLMLCVAYKPIYDAREGADLDPTWQLCHLEMVGVIPGLVLAFMETVVLAAISVAISTRLPMLANFIICFSIYVLGHLTPLVVQSSVEMFEPVRFVAELVATILPVLDHFNIQAAVAAGVGVPHDYLGWALLYCLIYGVIALLLALVLFEDRDLA